MIEPDPARPTPQGRHRAVPAALKLDSRGVGTVRRITNSYMGRSAKLMPVVALLSILTALAQALTLVILAAAGVALAAGGRKVHLNVGPLHHTTTVTTATLTASGIALLMIVLQIYAGKLAAGLAKIAEAECRRRVVESYLDAPWELIAQRERGELQQVLTNNVFRVSRAVVYRAVFVFGLANLVVLLGAGLVVAPVVALLMIAAGGILAIPLTPVKRMTQRAAEEHSVSERRFATFIAAIVEQARESRVFNIGARLGAQSNELSDASAENQRRMQFLTWTTPAIYLGGALLALTLGVTLLAAVGPAQLASVGTMVVLFLRSLVYGQTALSAMQFIVEANPYLVELEEHLDTYRDAVPVDGRQQPGTLERLELRDVRYVYPKSPCPALDGISISIGRGDAIGIVGSTGSGKSTLAEVVLGLRTPTRGQYTVNGIALSDVAHAAWSRQIAYVPQHSVIVDGTIRENIRYYRSWIDDAAVEQAARDAHIDAEIRRMPEGYDTVVAGLSVGLSGGQRQRLCIARALAGKPELLVMDEPTSGLDVNSERLFVETINRLRHDTTLVVIAHRLDTIAMCDRVIVVSAGLIENEGPPSEILAGGLAFPSHGSNGSNGSVTNGTAAARPRPTPGVLVQE